MTYTKSPVVIVIVIVIDSLGSGACCFREEYVDEFSFLSRLASGGDDLVDR